MKLHTQKPVKESKSVCLAARNRRPSPQSMIMRTKELLSGEFQLVLVSGVAW